MDRADILYPLDFSRFSINTKNDWAINGSSDNILAQTFPRWAWNNISSAQVTPTSGTMRLVSGITLLAGDVVRSISVMSGTTAGASLTHQWFCLVDFLSLTVLTVTSDDTSNGWAGGVIKTLSISGAPYINPIDRMIYVGVVIAGTFTIPSIVAMSDNGAGDFGITGVTPMLAANATAGLTSPVAVGTSVSPLTAAPSIFWVSVNGDG